MSDDRLAALEHRLKLLEDERAIARLIASYGPLVDAGEAEAVASLWALDGSYDVGDWVMSSRAEVDAMVKSDAHQGLMARGCCHFFGPPVVTVDGDTAQRGVPVHHPGPPRGGRLSRDARRGPPDPAAPGRATAGRSSAASLANSTAAVRLST